MTALTTQDRFRGALLGLAVGDALGAQVEFMERDTFPPVTGMAGGGFWRLKPGEWTDDTAMAMALAVSLVRKGWNPYDQIERLWAWRERGEYSSNGACFDIGSTTIAGLLLYRKTGDPLGALDSEELSGNGSLVRIAPVAMRYAFRHREIVADKCAESSRTTHGSYICRFQCAWLGKLLAGLLRGERLKPKDAQEFWEIERDEIKSGGYVTDTLDAALWSVYRTDNFRDAVLTAVNLGDDADSVGAVAGQLAGAYYGAAAIPADWLEVLARRAELANLADSLYLIATSEVTSNGL